MSQAVSQVCAAAYQEMPTNRPHAPQPENGLAEIVPIGHNLVSCLALSQHNCDPLPHSRQNTVPKTDKPKILVVNDDAGSLLALTSLLEQWADATNYTVLAARSGHEALRQVLLHDFAVILLDVNMPGMGGLAAAAELQLLCPDAHISLMTATIQMNTRRRAAELGLGFLAKPMTAQRIGALLDAID